MIFSNCNIKSKNSEAHTIFDYFLSPYFLVILLLVGLLLYAPMFLLSYFEINWIPIILILLSLCFVTINFIKFKKVIICYFSSFFKNKNKLNIKRVFYVLIFIFFIIFLLVKYNCEKLHQNVLLYGSENKIETEYIVKSKIRNNCLYADITGPISKITPYYNYEVLFYVKDKNGTTLGKSIIKGNEIFHQRDKTITFSTIIPNVTWKDRFAGLEINISLPYICYSSKYVNSNLNKETLTLNEKPRIRYKSIKYVLDSYGIDRENAKMIIKDIHQKYSDVLVSTETLRKQIMCYKCGETLANYSYVDNNKVILSLEGSDFDEYELNNKNEPVLEFFDELIKLLFE